MSERSPITARLMSGMIVLTLGVLWMLDNLGQIDASRILRWWPAVALLWGMMALTGLGRPRRPISGAVWTFVGLVGLLDLLGIVSASVFDLWPLALVALGAVLVVRSMRGSSAPAGAGGADGPSGGPRLDAFAFVGSAQRKVVAQDFASGNVSALLGAAVVDFRSAALAGARAEVDVFAALGGIDLIVPVGWRVVGQVTPVLGAFQDATASPADPNAPLLIVRGTVFMGGVEVLNEPRELRVYGSGRAGRGGRVVVGPGGVIVGGVVAGRRDRPEDAE